jgi:hypothetical protein
MHDITIKYIDARRVVLSLTLEAAAAAAPAAALRGRSMENMLSLSLLSLTRSLGRIDRSCREESRLGASRAESGTTLPRMAPGRHRRGGGKGQRRGLSGSL